MKQSAPYKELQQLLDQDEVGMGAAELHGALCAHLALASAPTVQGWLVSAFGSRVTPGHLEPQTQAALTALFNWTAEGIGDPQFGFRLLLPDDSAPLGDRTEALTDWCNGFLSGLGMGGYRERGKLPPEADEFLRDLGEIARADFHTGDGGNEEEQALFELTDYARVGAMLVYETLRGPHAGEVSH